MTSFSLFIDTPPVGKARPRLSKNGHAYTPTATTVAEQIVREAWDAAGRPRLEGPLALSVRAIFCRPASHLRKDGTVRPARRIAIPGRIDWDNIGKLIADSLNGYAWNDDRQVVFARVAKCWGGTPGLEVTAWETDVLDRREGVRMLARGVS